MGMKSVYFVIIQTIIILKDVFKSSDTLDKHFFIICSLKTNNTHSKELDKLSHHFVLNVRGKFSMNFHSCFTGLIQYPVFFLMFRHPSVLNLPIFCLSH